MVSILLDRFQVIEGSPPVMPHNCSICGSIRGKFIDFGLDVDYYGRVYFCESCLLSAAKVFGLVSKEVWDKSQELIAILEDHTKKLLKENNEFRNSIAALTNIISQRNDLLNPAEIPERRENTITNNSGTSSRKERPAKPTNESRSTGLPRDDSLDDLLKEI